jgi:hypothetical protein
MCLRRWACASSRYRPGERTHVSGKSRIVTNPHARRYIVTGFPDNSARIFGLSRTLPAEPTASPDPAPGRAKGQDGTRLRGWSVPGYSAWPS